MINNDKLQEKIIDIILPKEVVYKETKGAGTPPSKRHGVIDDEYLYLNRKVINTRNGLTPFTPQIKMYFRAFTNDDSVLTIDIYDYDMKCLIKKFTIKSLNNTYTISDMKLLTQELIDILNSDSKNKTVDFIEHIREKTNLKYEEVAQ